jgi:23S rRNA pseudouridine2605 synthase
MRLNAFLARAGLASRREADELIKTGRVQVNGQTGQLNTAVSDSDLVFIDGKRIQTQNLRYILLNKPRNVVTTSRDPEGRPTVTGIIDIKERVVPVGRLDTNTTGALLLTNDGNLAHKLMHPSFEIDKVYQAQVSGQVTDEKLKKLERGIQLEDGKTAPAKAKKLIIKGQTFTGVELTIHEGRNHQVKRMLAAVGLKVKKLHRSQYGPLDLRDLKAGQWRNLIKAEINQLKTL